MITKLVISILIVLVSLIYGFPNIILFNKLGSDYNPLVISGQSPIARDEAFAYAPFVNYILNGNFYLRDVYVTEFADFPTPYMGETAPALIFAVLARLTGSIEKAFIAADFIFPPIIFFLFYVLTSFFIKNRGFALATAFLTVIARDFIAVIPYPHETFQYLTFAEGQNYLLYFSRAFHPQLTFILFLSAALLLIKLVSNPKNKIIILGLGLVFGTLFYSYIFHWTYFALAFSFVFLYIAVKRDWAVARSLAMVCVVAVIVGLPYFYNIWQFNKLDLAEDFVNKTSLHGLPLPLTLLRYLVITIFFAFATKLKSYLSAVFFLVLLAGVTISPISRIIVGQDLETFHYLRRALMPLATISFFIIIYQILIKRNFSLTIISIIIFSSTLFLALKNQIIATEKVKSAHQKDRAQEVVFNWLKQNTQKGSVVGSLDTTFNSLLPIYTHNYVYFPPTDRTIMPTDEGVDRFLILANLLGLSLENQRMMLSDKSLLSYLFVYQTYENRKLSVDSVKAKSARIRGQDLYEIKWQEKAKEFRMDYLITTSRELSLIQPDLRFLNPIAAIGDYLIFKYQK